MSAGAPGFPVVDCAISGDAVEPKGETVVSLPVPVAVLVFLWLNGIELEADATKLKKLVIDVAQGKAGKNTIADFLRKNSRA